MIKTLDDLTNSNNESSFGSSSDDWINSPDRMQRCAEAARNGCDGSTHQECIDDWRESLEVHDIDSDDKERISAEIDECEKWHVDNGSIDDEIG